jgi:hypothetical protein
MSGIDELLTTIPIPRMLGVFQHFERPELKDPEEEIKRLLAEKNIYAHLPPGASIAVAVGSRGITNLPEVTKTIVQELKKAGTRPFLVPAMGSHGGATGEGQKALLEHLGMDEKSMGAPIRSTMDVVQVSVSPKFGMPVYLDAYAAEADGIVVINRIKAHAAYSYTYESGLVKMTAVGLGKQKTAEICHNLGAERIGEYVADIGLEGLKKFNIIAAIGLVENAYHETARITVLQREEVEQVEPELLIESKKMAARFYLDEFDVLIIDEIGKEISGAGFDTNIVGRYSSPYLRGGPNIRRVAVLDITEKSKGYGGGLGMVDFTTRRAFEKFDPEQTYPNTLTSTFTNGVKIPMILKNDRQAIQACIRTCNRIDIENVRMVRIKNTLHMDHIEVSESMLEAVREHPDMHVEGELSDIVFNEKGNLF